jgi:MYXO-CTERM domain-containing protein
MSPFLLALTLSAGWARPSVVFLGNSYTLRHELPTVTTAMLDGMTAEIYEVESTVLATGGFTLEEHALSVGTRESYRDVFQRRHEWFLLQEQSQTPGFPEGTPEREVGERSAIELHEQVGLTGAESVLFLTWGRLAGDETNPSLYPDFLTMQGHLTNGIRAYAAAMEEASGRRVWIAPVGEAFRSVYEEAAAAGDPLAEGSPFVALYEADGSHESAEGAYLAACVIAATVTGRAPQGGMPGVGEAARRILQRHAEAVVLDDPFGAWSYPWTYELDDWLAKSGDDPISDLWSSPTVRVSARVDDVPVWTVGVQHPQGAGEGRLYVDDGGELIVQTGIVLGRGGRGELVVAGGVVEVPEVAMAEGALDSGLISVRDGRLDVEAVRVGAGVGGVALQGGTLSASEVFEATLVQSGGVFDYSEALVVEGDYRLTGGRLVLLEDRVLTVLGSATLGGEVALRAPAALGTVVLRAAVITTEGWTLVGMPEGLTLGVVEGASGQELVVQEAAAVDTEVLLGDDSDMMEDAAGCGCSTGASGGWLGLVLALAGVRRRRAGR